VRLAASNLRSFLIAQVVRKETAFGLDDEIKALLSVDLHQHGPIGIVAAERRRD
jgi:hypothetical protein